ncbi:MAG: DUF1440 domain-containing protein [Chloroflexota bacterium]|nr:DUF1440 domain-containing protein [Chloroflexota bacterium]
MAKAGERNHWKGFVLGLVGGAVGTWAMGAYWGAVTALAGDDPRQAKVAGGPHGLDDISLVGQHYKAGESSTAALGRLIGQAVLGKPPGKQATTLLSNAVHWSYGSLLGGLYGAVRGGTGLLDVPGGLAYGTGVGLLGSEVALPLLGLAAGPTTQPLESHAYGLGAHWVYGLAVAATTQVLDALL